MLKYGCMQQEVDDVMADGTGEHAVGLTLPAALFECVPVATRQISTEV